MQTILYFLQDGLVYLLAFVLLLGILVFVHELGHFMVARWCGVRVEVFSLGFGKKIWKTVRGDTTYAVSIIPLGGYVKMYGDQPGQDVPEEDKKVSFTHKSVWQRIAIVLAGPLMNFFFAIVIFGVVAMIGLDYRGPVLGDIETSTAAFEAGFRSGDRIVSVGGQSVTTFDQVSKEMNKAIGSALTFSVQREGGSPVELSVPIRGIENPNPLSLDETIGDIDGLTTMARASVVGVPEQSTLWTLGLRTGDLITKINDKKISRWTELEHALASANPGSPLQFSIDRGEGPQKQSMDLTLAGTGHPLSTAFLRLEKTDLYLDKVVSDSPAQKAGLAEGDRLVSINGHTLNRWEEVLERIKGYSGEGGVEIQYMRGANLQTTKVTPLVTSQINAFGGEDKRYTIGIMPLIRIAMPEIVTISTANPLQAVATGVEQTWDFSVITVLSFVRLFQSKISPKTIGGVLSIGQAAGETMKLGISKFLTMMAIISVNLFVLNLLPIPVLDGGHLVFYTIEAVKGSPLSLRKMEMAQQVGMFLLMGLMVFALFNDVTRLFFGKI